LIPEEDLDFRIGSFSWEEMVNIFQVISMPGHKKVQEISLNESIPGIPSPTSIVF